MDAVLYWGPKRDPYLEKYLCMQTSQACIGMLSKKIPRVQGFLPSRGKVAAQPRHLGLMFWT